MRDDAFVCDGCGDLKSLDRYAGPGLCQDCLDEHWGIRGFPRLSRGKESDHELAFQRLKNEVLARRGLAPTQVLWERRIRELEEDNTNLRLGLIASLTLFLITTLSMGIYPKEDLQLVVAAGWLVAAGLFFALTYYVGMSLLMLLPNRKERKL